MSDALEDTVPIPEEEKTAAVHFINQLLSHDPDLHDIMPINADGDEIYTVVHDGILLCKLLNLVKPDAVEIRALNRNKSKLDSYKIWENQNLLINSARAVGCSVMNVKPKEILGKPIRVFSLIWQIIRLILGSRINIIHHPELFLLTEYGEDIPDLRTLTSEQMLLRWFNFFLARANPGFSRRVSNFTTDLKDCCCYTVFLATLAPEYCDRAPLKEPDPVKRAELVLTYAERLGMERFMTAKDIASGNERLNFALTAWLFNVWAALTRGQIAGLQKFSDLRDLPLICDLPDQESVEAGTSTSSSSSSASSSSASSPSSSSSPGSVPK